MASEDLPEDLLRLQREFFEAEAAWRCAAAGTDSEATAAAYHRTQDAALALHRHPVLAEAENRFQTRMRLREAARPSGG